MNTQINRLLHFAMQKELLNAYDIYYAANRLLDILHVANFTPETIDENLQTARPILDEMLDYAVRSGLIEDTTEERDLFDTRRVRLRSFAAFSPIMRMHQRRRRMPSIR